VGPSTAIRNRAGAGIFQEHRAGLRAPLCLHSIRSASMNSSNSSSSYNSIMAPIRCSVTGYPPFGKKRFCQAAKHQSAACNQIVSASSSLRRHAGGLAYLLWLCACRVQLASINLQQIIVGAGWFNGSTPTACRRTSAGCLCISSEDLITESLSPIVLFLGYLCS
jgi:hypothetical protein